MRNSLSEAAVKKFGEGYSCSQAIVLTYGTLYGIDERTAKTVARSFGGGMARTCQTCGAVTGAYMVLGFKNDSADEKLAKEKTYALVQEFSRRFQAKHGHVNCRQLLNCDLGTEEGQEYFKNNNLYQKCAGFVRDTACILEDLVKD